MMGGPGIKIVWELSSRTKYRLPDLLETTEITVPEMCSFLTTRL